MLNHGCSSPATIVLLTIAMLFAAGMPVFADEGAGTLPPGTPTIGLKAGPFFPIRLTDGQSTKLSGAATSLSASWVLNAPPSSGWYRGQVSLGAELVGFSTTEPFGAYGIGLTPMVGYSFTALRRLRPYLEGGAGPVWTDLGGRVPEEPGQFNFLVWGGAGLSWDLTPQWAVQAGYRFMHMSNADTRQPNTGLNFGLPFVGLSYSRF